MDAAQKSFSAFGWKWHKETLGMIQSSGINRKWTPKAGLETHSFSPGFVSSENVEEDKIGSSNDGHSEATIACMPECHPPDRNARTLASPHSKDLLGSIAFNGRVSTPDNNILNLDHSVITLENSDSTLENSDSNKPALQ
jgi:hypothetical protein